MSDEHYENVRCDGCGKWASCCSCDEDRHSVIVNLLNPKEDSGPDQPALKAGASVHGSIGARRLPDTTPEEHGLRGDDCMTCGDPITRSNLGIHFHADGEPLNLWQCADCYRLEWGIDPFRDVLSWPQNKAKAAPPPR